MTPKEVLELTREELKTIVWSGTSNLVFGNSVQAVPKLSLHQLSRFPASPKAFVIDDGEKSDTEHPGLIIMSIQILLFIENFGEEHGESAVLDGNRVADTSAGAGVKSIEQETLLHLLKAYQVNGLKSVFQGLARSKFQGVKNNFPIIFKILNFEVFCSIY